MKIMKRIGFGKIALIALVAFLATAAVGIVFAQQRPSSDGGMFGGHRRGGHHRGGPGGGPHRGGLPLHDLNLSEEQRAQVRQVTERFHGSTRALHDQLRTLGENDFVALQSGTFNEAQARAAAQARANVMIELDVAHARHMFEIYSLLTPEQKAQLAERRQEMERRMQERRTRRESQSGGQN